MTQVLKAEDAVYGGYVISRDGGVVFIKGAIPGELVEVEFKDRKRDYSVASVTSIVQPSESRVEPPCPVFGICGGCQLQYMHYDAQKELKHDVLRDCLRRIGDIEIDLSEPLTGDAYGYRRRAQFKVSKEGLIGFYREGTRDMVSITECPLMCGDINRALQAVTSISIKGIKEIHITYGDSLLAFIKGRGFDESLSEQFIGAGFSSVCYEDGSHRGAGFTGFSLDGMEYSVSAWSFLQSNWEINNKAVCLILDRLGDISGAEVLDLYAGGGNFSLGLARAGAHVIAVEENPYSVSDGQRNASLNGIKSLKFIKGSAEAARLKEQYGIIILDPPRPGLSNDAIIRVTGMNAEKIVYVSCNPSTFARDLKKLAPQYEIESISLIDFFPNTYHVESIAFLKRR